MRLREFWAVWLGLNPDSEHGAIQSIRWSPDKMLHILKMAIWNANPYLVYIKISLGFFLKEPMDNKSAFVPEMA